MCSSHVVSIIHREKPLQNVGQTKRHNSERNRRSKRIGKIARSRTEIVRFCICQFCFFFPSISSPCAGYKTNRSIGQDIWKATDTFCVILDNKFGWRVHFPSIVLAIEPSKETNQKEIQSLINAFNFIQPDWLRIDYLSLCPLIIEGK